MWVGGKRTSFSSSDFQNLHSGKTSVSSVYKSVNAWPWEPGMDFRGSLNIVQGSSPQCSSTVTANSPGKEIKQPLVDVRESCRA